MEFLTFESVVRGRHLLGRVFSSLLWYQCGLNVVDLNAGYRHKCHLMPITRFILIVGIGLC
ncbi:hypothetical protein sync_1481 [Synechococcus sp. CC9311]|nr:hypothetical protein sync_1481 [Synechococcus sp. CC9311]